MDVCAPSNIDEIVFLGRAQRSEERKETKGKRIQKTTERKNTLLADNKFSVENMAENYKFSV